MKYSHFHSWLFGVISGTIVAMLTIAWAVQAQEKPVHELRTWEVLRLQLSLDPSIHVVDTEGVCIYVLLGGLGASPHSGISTVPKTQLPPGTGCQ